MAKKEVYSNLPQICKCPSPQPIRTEAGIRCWACAKRLPKQREAIATLSESIREEREQAGVPKKFR